MMTDFDEKISSIKKHGRKYRGRKELLKHLKGEKLTQRQMILGNCYECCGYYSDGSSDCGIESCTFYPLMPYRGKKEKDNLGDGD